MIYVLSCLVWGTIYLALNFFPSLCVRGEAFEHTTFEVSLLKNKFNNICFSPLLGIGKAINFILKKECGKKSPD